MFYTEPQRIPITEYNELLANYMAKTDELTTAKTTIRNMARTLERYIAAYPVETRWPRGAPGSLERQTHTMLLAIQSDAQKLLAKVGE